MLLDGAGGARKKSEEVERQKGFNRKNEMILERENLPRQMFIVEYKIKKLFWFQKKINAVEI